jgi:hypothetical protein
MGQLSKALDDMQQLTFYPIGKKEPLENCDQVSDRIRSAHLKIG